MAYWPVARNDFINYDDDDYVVGNEFVNRGLSVQSVAWAMTAFHDANWHPLTWLSHMIDCQLFGPAPAGHHLVNLGLHAVNSMLLYCVLLRMTRAAWPSLAVAAFFAVHPLHVESVAWVAERKDVLSTMFGLLALSAWLSYLARPGLGRYLAVILWFAASLMSKAMLVTLPFLLLLLDYWPLGRAGSWGQGVGSREQGAGSKGQGVIQSSRHTPCAVRPAAPAAGLISEAGSFWRTAHGACLLRCVLEKLPLVLMSVASCVVTVIAQWRGYAVVPLSHHSLAARVATVAEAYCGYLWKMVVPMNLAPIYPRPKIVDYPAGIACGIAILAATLLVVLAGRTRRYLIAGWLWYLGMLVPVIGIVQVGQQSMADRYSYLPLVGIFIIVIWSAADAARRWPRLRSPLAGLTAAALAACCVLTSAQVHRWFSTETLFTHTLSVTEENAAALTNLGLVAIQKDDYDEARRRLGEALRIDPGFIDALGNMGAMYAKQKNYAAAIDQYSKIVSIVPRNVKALGNMARAFTNLGNHVQAEIFLRRVVELEPASPDYRISLAQTQQMLGKTQEALENYEAVLRLRPGERGAVNNIAWIRAAHPDPQFRDGAKAVELLRALSAAPDCDSNLLDTLGAAYAEAGQFEEALSTAQAAIEKARAEKAPAESIKDMERRATLYKARKPYRDPQLLGLGR